MGGSADNDKIGEFFRQLIGKVFRLVRHQVMSFVQEQPVWMTILFTEIHQDREEFCKKNGSIYQRDRQGTDNEILGWLLQQVADLFHWRKYCLIANDHGARQLQVIPFRIDEAELVILPDHAFDYREGKSGFPAARSAGHQYAVTSGTNAKRVAILQLA